jgi:exopolyphosphatase/pppGpp-phosphohydrolase
METKIAALDISTFAVRLLVIRFSEQNGTNKFERTFSLQIPLSLHQGIHKQQKISRFNAFKLILILQMYRLLLSLYRIEFSRVTATSLLESASNIQALLQEIHQKTTLSIRLMDTEEEVRMWDLGFQAWICSDFLEKNELRHLREVLLDRKPEPKNLHDIFYFDDEDEFGLEYDW